MLIRRVRPPHGQTGSGLSSTISHEGIPKLPSLYVYKCRNDPYSGNSAYGDWDDVFSQSGPVKWGGAWATKHPTSLTIFESELQVGDLILAWQTDLKAAIGIAEVVGFTYVGQDKHVLLEAREEFPNPVHLHALKKTTNPELRTVSALKQGNVATIYRTDHREAQALLHACNSRYA
jgi:hypothetical protein